MKMTTALVYIAPKNPQWGLEGQCTTQRNLTSGPSELCFVCPGAFSGDKNKQHAGILPVLENKVCGNDRLAMHMCVWCALTSWQWRQRSLMLRGRKDIMIWSEWCRPLLNTLLSIRIPVVVCPLLLFAHLPLYFLSSGNFFPPFEMSPTMASSSSCLLQKERS